MEGEVCALCAVNELPTGPVASVQPRAPDSIMTKILRIEFRVYIYILIKYLKSEHIFKYKLLRF